ncbi:MAG: NUDIX domain-containing protein [Armatimonadota bacterium]
MSKKPFTLSLKAIILNNNDEILLLKRSSDSKNNPGLYDFPGGKLDLHEEFIDALIREINEETNLNPEIIRLIGSTESESPTNRVIYLFFECRVYNSDVKISDEHEEYQWLKPDEIDLDKICCQFKKVILDYIKNIYLK